MGNGIAVLALRAVRSVEARHADMSRWLAATARVRRAVAVLQARDAEPARGLAAQPGAGRVARACAGGAPRVPAVEPAVSCVASGGCIEMERLVAAGQTAEQRGRRAGGARTGDHRRPATIASASARAKPCGYDAR